MRRNHDASQGILDKQKEGKKKMRQFAASRFRGSLHSSAQNWTGIAPDFHFRGQCVEKLIRPPACGLRLANLGALVVSAKRNSWIFEIQARILR